MRVSPIFRRKIASEGRLGKILRAKFLDGMAVDTVYCSFVKHFPELQGLSRRLRSIPNAQGFTFGPPRVHAG